MRVNKLLFKEYVRELRKTMEYVGGEGDVQREVEKFANVFAKYIGTKYAIALNSGTDALQLSLTILGIKEGDKVIIPDLIYPVVGYVVKYVGAKPILIDVKREDLSIDVKQIQKHIDKNTKAIIAVHMFSQPCDIEEILHLARKYNLYVIEDCCQAESSEYKGKKLGSFGDLSCFSFSYYKPLSSCGGGGGMVCFNDPRYKDLLKYTQVWLDDKCLLDINKRFPQMYLLDLVAVRTKFKFLSAIIKSREKIKKVYEKELEGLRQVKIFKDKPKAKCVLQNYLILAEERDKLNNFLKKKGIISQAPYKPLHLLEAFKEDAKGRYFKNSEEYFKKAIHLPLFSFMKEEEAYYIANLIKHFYQK